MKEMSKVQLLTYTGMFAAAITVTTAYVLHIPLPTGGYIHLGDTLIYLAACLLPLPYAMAAGAVGGALADLLTAPMWTLPTFVIKALICLPFSRKERKLRSRRNYAAVVLAGLLSTTLYALTNVAFTGSWDAFLPQFLGTGIQAVGSGVVFVVLMRAVGK